MSFAVIHKIPDDKVISRKAHFDDDAKLVFQPFPDLVRDDFISFRNAFFRKVAKICRFPLVVFLGKIIVFCGGCKLRDFVMPCRRSRCRNEFDFIRNFDGVVKRFFDPRKLVVHFVVRFKVKFLGFKPYAVGVGQLLFHTDAHQHVLHVGVVLFNVVDVVRRDDFHVDFPCKPDEFGQRFLFFRNAVVLKFDIIIVAEDFFEFKRRPFRAFVIVLDNQTGHFALHAGGQTNYSFGILP